MKTTANEFRKKPHDAYAEAARGETVTINHDRYRDKVFELTARDRAHIIRFESEEDQFTPLDFGMDKGENK